MYCINLELRICWISPYINITQIRTWNICSTLEESLWPLPNYAALPHLSWHLPPNKHFDCSWIFWKFLCTVYTLFTSGPSQRFVSMLFCVYQYLLYCVEQYSVVWIHHNFIYILWFIGYGYSRCFQFGAIINKSAMDLLVHILLFFHRTAYEVCFPHYW